MQGKDDKDAGRRKWSKYRSPSRRTARDVARSAARLAPPEERMPAGRGRNGAGPDDTIRVKAGVLKPTGELLDEGEDEHGVFYMPPVVTVAVSLFLAYTIFVAVLIALG